MAIFVALSLHDARAENEWPKDTEYEGPMTFCGLNVALDLAEGEKLTVRDTGLHFLVYYVEGDRNLGIYEGYAPQGYHERVEIETPLQKRVWRVTDAGSIASSSYHVRTYENDEGFKNYAHVWSSQFDGSDSDFELLKSIRYGEEGQTGCSGQTYEQAS